MICFDDKELQNFTVSLYEKYFYDLPLNLKNIKFSHMKDDSVLGYSHPISNKGKQLINDSDSNITNEIFISNGYVGIDCTSTILHELCHAYVDCNFYDTEADNNFNHKGLWEEIAKIITNRSGINCFWGFNPDTKIVLAKDIVEKTMEKSKYLYEFFLKIDKDNNNRQLKRMINQDDTSEYLQLLMEDKDKSSWKKYWNRLIEWKNDNFEYWKDSNTTWMMYVAFDDL